MSSYSFHKRDCFNRAKNLFEKEDIASLKYACLELRQCIEAIAYAKALSYEKYIPEKELYKWQPKKVFAYLEENAPLSTQNHSLRITKENPDGSLGDSTLVLEHTTLKAKNFNKHYHKLGNYLHTPSLQDQASKINHNNLKDFVQEVIEDLQPVVECGYDSNLEESFKIECVSCKKIFPIRKARLSAGQKFNCLRVECQTSYLVLEITEDGSLIHRPMECEFQCSCGNNNNFYFQNNKETYSLNCKCGKNHIISKEWHREEHDVLADTDS